MIKNDPEKRWVNGSIGTIHDIAEKKIKVKINHKIYEVKKEKWDRIQYSYDDNQQEVLENVTGSFKQYPVRLAWAITIHKSQGQTFEKVIIDMSQGSFAPGQLYVALSRCISLEGIELLRPLKKSDVIVNKHLIGFQDRLI
jgi:ATP-dependent exoDNAse (exonuclease V) alpha subunit